MKTCTRCHESLDLLCFTKDKYTSDGLNRRCRGCIREANKSKYKRWIERGKMPADLKYGVGVKHPNYSKSSKLFWRYGMSLADRDDMLKRQNGLCAICSEPLVKPHIDHDHVTNIVRGLLCAGCNLGLGSFKDNRQNLLNAVDYLQRINE